MKYTVLEQGFYTNKQTKIWIESAVNYSKASLGGP